MDKRKENSKVGRPKLANQDLIKDSWCKIIASLSICFVFMVCGVGVLTNRTPFQVLTFQNPNKIKANIVKKAKPLTTTKQNKKQK